jgi:hypothetical protein
MHSFRLPALPRRCAIPAAALALTVVLVFLWGMPLAAYTIWMKDGSMIISRGKYVVKGAQAIITLNNGTQTFTDLALIDVAKTDASNHGTDYNVTELGNTRVVPGQAAPPAKAKTLGDLVASHSPSSRELPSARRATGAEPGVVARSIAGNMDLAMLPQTPFAQTEVRADLQQFFHSQGIDDELLLAGSQPDHLLVLFNASSEGSVFQGLSASGIALLHARERFPQQVADFELLFLSPAREKGGQFLLTPENAADLVSKKVDAASFFVSNVQF